jgi:hypothetical protein
MTKEEIEKIYKEKEKYIKNLQRIDFDRIAYFIRIRDGKYAAETKKYYIKDFFISKLEIKDNFLYDKNNNRFDLDKFNLEEAIVFLYYMRDKRCTNNINCFDIDNSHYCINSYNLKDCVEVRDSNNCEFSFRLTSCENVSMSRNIISVEDTIGYDPTKIFSKELTPEIIEGLEKKK